MRTTRTLITALFCTTVLTSAAGADVLLDNLAEPTRDITILGTADPDMIWAAQAFTTPTRVRLDQVGLLLGRSVGGPDVAAQLRSGEDASGSAITSFAVSTIEEVATAVATLTPQTPTVLEPGVQYWVVLGVVSTGSFGWAYADGNASIGPGTLGPYAYSADFGLTWGPAGVENPYQVRIEVTPFCPADFNGSGTVSVQDIFDFLAAYFATDPSADFNGSGAISVQDIFDFLAAYFSGC